MGKNELEVDDRAVADLFAEHLTVAIEQREPDDLSDETIRASVEFVREPVLRLVEVQQQGWEQAWDRLVEARNELERKAPRKWFGIGASGVFLVAIAVLVVSMVVDGFGAGYFLIGFWLLALVAIGIWAIRLQAHAVLSIDQLSEGCGKARERFIETLDHQLTIAVRRAVNQEHVSCSMALGPVDDRGLRQLADPEREVSTRVQTELASLVKSLSNGSIGLAGPRGAGKTTLIRQFAEGPSKPHEMARTGLVVSAPVKYDAKEFVLHLFARLCEQVLEDYGRNDLTRRRHSGRVRKTTLFRMLLGIVGSVLVAIGAGMWLIPEIQEFTAGYEAAWLTATGFVVLYFWLLMWVTSDKGSEFRDWMNRWRGRQSGTAAESPVHAAEELLDQIRFQQSISTKGSSSMKMPFGLGATIESTLTRSRTPWTLPEVVEEFREFAGQLAGADRYVVVGIDELDKMETIDAAREFLNNIKGVFGAKGCFYLVSVSDDAMSSFERRGLPFRDVFDSAFDSILRVDFLTLGESRDVLEGRVTGVPVPFQCLSYSLAGGLPRDLIRTTRELLNQRRLKLESDRLKFDSSKEYSLGVLSASVVAGELRSKVAAALEVIRSANAGVFGDRVVIQLRRLNEMTSTFDPAASTGFFDGMKGLAQKLVEVLRSSSAATDDPGIRAVRQVTSEVAAFTYFSVTVGEVFRTEGGAGTLWASCDEEREVVTKEIGEVVNGLAVARQTFSLSPGIAWSAVDQARSGTWLDPWPAPRLRAEPLPP